MARPKKVKVLAPVEDFPQVVTEKEVEAPEAVKAPAKFKEQIATRKGFYVIKTEKGYHLEAAGEVILSQLDLTLDEALKLLAGLSR